MSDPSFLHFADCDAAPEAAATQGPPHYAVDQWRRTAARIAGVALASTGLSHRSAAALTGCTRSLVDRWTSETFPRSIPLARILVLGTSGRRGREAAKAILVSAISHIEDEHEAPSPGPSLRDLVDVLRAEMGDVDIAWREAMADGTVDDKERARLIRELADVRRELDVLVHRLSKGAA